MNGSSWLQRLIEFQERLDYRFNNLSLLEEALTHASYANESGLLYCNERLEYLGDAVLELCVSERLFRLYPDKDEGELTCLRSRLVCEMSLYNWALCIGVPSVLRLGRGLERQRGRKNPSVLADAVEAVLGGVFLDSDYPTVRALTDCLNEPVSFPTYDDNRNAKTVLQERLQARGEKPPVYDLVGREGPDHAVRFRIILKLPGGQEYEAWDNSIKGAQMRAALKALEVLNMGKDLDSKETS